MTKISLIIPCYNESKNLPLLIERFKVIASKETSFEIVVVDNGSTDETSRVLEELTSNLPFITRVKVDFNKGYGHGILAGLRVASGEILGWTHADLQTDPVDVLRGFEFFLESPRPELLFIKGRRYGRPITDVLFTIGMSIFEILLLRKLMWDINAQPTMFHKDFFMKWESPPDDFSLDLYAYFMAKKTKLIIKRFPVLFAKRAYGVSNWNVSFLSKYRFIKRTLVYSLDLYRKIN
jgi:glycosyltransferase involved in cell wall biosynthesis